jgi:hypothetical protein
MESLKFRMAHIDGIDFFRPKSFGNDDHSKTDTVLIRRFQ